MSAPSRIDPAQVASLDIVEGALAREEDSYRQRAQSIDTRLGLLLAAAGVVVAVVGPRPSVAGLVGQVVAMGAGGVAVYGLWPRVDKGIAPRKLRDRYLSTDPLLTRLRLLSTRLELHEADEKSLLAKARRLRVTALLLLTAATAIVVGLIVKAFCEGLTALSRTVSTPRQPEQQSRETPGTQWDELYPPDPDLMASAEGDRRGLAELQRVARRRIDELRQA